MAHTKASGMTGKNILTLLTDVVETRYQVAAHGFADTIKVYEKQVATINPMPNVTWVSMSLLITVTWMRIKQPVAKRLTS